MRSSVCTRSVMSRTAATAKTSSPSRSGLRLISTGNIDPSERRADRVSSAPIERTVGAARYLVRWARWTDRRASGKSSSTSTPSNASGAHPNSFPAWSLTNTISPVLETTMVASGAASSNDQAKSSPNDCNSGDRTPIFATPSEHPPLTAREVQPRVSEDQAEQRLAADVTHLVRASWRRSPPAWAPARAPPARFRRPRC